MVCAELGLSAQFVKERAEEAAPQGVEEAFDIATARAVARLNKFGRILPAAGQSGGIFPREKAESAAEELEEARGAIRRLGGEVVALRRFRLPGGDERGIIVIKKISQTPTAYPRNAEKIAKSPLK